MSTISNDFCGKNMLLVIITSIIEDLKKYVTRKGSNSKTRRLQ